MPLYEYLCKDCGARFDVLRSFKDADKTISCKSCHSQQTERAISVFFAKGNDGALAGSSSTGCAGCGGGSCASCGGHH
jgi:putative FmdB family regulatory protein